VDTTIYFMTFMPMSIEPSQRASDLHSVLLQNYIGQYLTVRCDQGGAGVIGRRLDSKNSEGTKAYTLPSVSPQECAQLSSPFYAAGFLHAKSLERVLKMLS
jgi:hypothetical protein